MSKIKTFVSNRMTKKRLLWGMTAAASALAILPMLSAFEAHVINVTAKIENALSVTTDAIDFGTVFPQEHLNKPLTVTLSQSFLDEGRVDDVNYFIRQKPKCAITRDGGTTFDPANTATGHVIIGDNPATATTTETYYIDCGEPPRPLHHTETWGVLPSLCEYISKEPDRTPANDGTLPSFHIPWVISTSTGTTTIVWNDVHGHLAKSEQDTTDVWNIDLAVPCFGGFCAQDWADFVHGINPNADPNHFTQPIANEHKIFGCDLWVEVSGISTATSTEPASITLIKQFEQGSFSTTTVLRIDGGAVPQNVAQPVSPNANHVISEDPVSGYELVGISGAGCPTSTTSATTFSPISLNPGQNITCTITNRELDAVPVPGT